MNMQLKNLTGMIFVRKESLMKMELGWAELGLRIRLIQCESSVDRDSGNWFCLSVMTGREEAVEKALNLFGIKALVPMRKGPDYKSRGRTIEGQMMPVMKGYVLVKLNSQHPSFLGIKGLKHVIDVVGGSHKPMIISQQSVNDFKAKAERGEHDHKAGRAECFKAGQMVTVMDGPFEKLTGTVVRNVKNDQRVIVDVELFGRKVQVDLVVDQVKLLCL